MLIFSLVSENRSRMLLTKKAWKAFTLLKAVHVPAYNWHYVTYRLNQIFYVSLKKFELHSRLTAC